MAQNFRQFPTAPHVDPTYDYHLVHKKYVDDVAGEVEGGIVTDHGDMDGLADDDHSQYHTDGRGDARYYTQVGLDAGQLDNRYYTETESDLLYATITHASTHQNGGADSIKLDNLATPDDNSDLDATAALHGLMSKAYASKLDGIDEGADVTADNETSHADVLVDGDFGSDGFLIRSGGVGSYSVDTNSYSVTTHDHDADYAAIDHDHDLVYAAIDHSHDHGDLDGLDDNDHTQYALLSGATFTGDVTITPITYSTNQSGGITISTTGGQWVWGLKAESNAGGSPSFSIYGPSDSSGSSSAMLTFGPGTGVYNATFAGVVTVDGLYMGNTKYFRQGETSGYKSYRYTTATDSYIRPETDGQGNLRIGHASYSWENIYMYAGGGTALTINSSQNATFAGTLQAKSTFVLAATTETAIMELGSGRTGDGTTIIDFHTDTTYTDYSLRLQRSDGANGAAWLTQRGAGALNLKTLDAASVSIYTDNTLAFTINSTQGAHFYGSVYTDDDKPFYIGDDADGNITWISASSILYVRSKSTTALEVLAIVQQSTHASSYMWLKNQGGNNLLIDQANATGSIIMRTGGTSPTTALTLNASQNATFSGSIYLGDSKYLCLGAGVDASLMHSGYSLYLDNRTGSTYFRTGASGTTTALEITSAQLVKFYLNVIMYFVSGATTGGDYSYGKIGVSVDGTTRYIHLHGS